MRVIFLDTDVLTSDDTNHEYEKLDRSCVSVLDKLCQDCSASVVITDTWRAYRQLNKIQYLFRWFGFSFPKLVIGYIPSGRGYDRPEHEIEGWLDDEERKGTSIEGWVVFDTELQAKGIVKNHLILVDKSTGLQEAQANEASFRLKPLILPVLDTEEAIRDFAAKVADSVMKAPGIRTPLVPGPPTDLKSK